MTYEAAFQKIKDYLHQQFEVAEELITPDANLFKTLKLDSIDALDMIGALEAELNVAVRDDELKKLRTVDDVVNYVVRNAPA